jgi:hypothetical protein
LEQEGRLTRPRSTKDEQGAVQAIEGIDQLRTWHLHLVAEVRALHEEVQGAGNHCRAFDQA